MAAGMIGYVPALTPPLIARDAPADFERTKTIDEVPRPVRKAIDIESHGHAVELIQQVRHNGHEFFRVVITQRGAEDRLLRFSIDGHVISKEEVEDTDWAPPRHPAEAPHEVERPDDRRDHPARNYYRDEDITVTVDHPMVAKFENVPPRVRAVMGREAEGAAVNTVVAYRDKGNVIYQANVQDVDNKGKTRVIQVTSDGRLYGEANVGGGAAEIRDVHFEEAPQAVRDTVQREAGGKPAATITGSTRHGRTVYSTEIPTRHGTRFLTIASDGRILSDITD
jgi:hypothetical protein